MNSYSRIAGQPSQGKHSSGTEDGDGIEEIILSNIKSEWVKGFLSPSQFAKSREQRKMVRYSIELKFICFITRMMYKVKGP